MNDLFDNRSNRNRVPVSGFQPGTHNERVLYEIAKELGEPYIDFLKSVNDRFGFDVIWNAWSDYEKAVKRGAVIRNPRAFFNYLVDQRRPDRNGGDRL